MSKVLVTGASGFVGSHLCRSLARLGYSVVGSVRSTQLAQASAEFRLLVVGEIGPDTNWNVIPDDIELVVHLAARVHVMREQEDDPVAAFRKVNVEGTERLLRSENLQNVKRVIFVSTVKVHGDVSGSSPFTSQDKPAPPDPYAASKLDAECIVEELGSEIGFETVIIRPPLVYGPGVGGNFFRLLRMVDKGVPLPFGRVHNKRSLVNVKNLCDLIGECLTNTSAPRKRFLVSDNSDVSTPDLIRCIAAAMGRPARLLPVPVKLLSSGAKLVGRSAEMSRLVGSLQVDIEETMNCLDWKPPVVLTDCVQSTVDWYLEQEANA